MSTQPLATGTVHTVPSDLRKALSADSKAVEKWNDLTPLARNEWICWTIFPKQAKTRAEHVSRVVSELKEGMRRPCCWLGCTHRTDKKISKSVQWVLDKKKKKTK